MLAVLVWPSLRYWLSFDLQGTDPGDLFPGGRVVLLSNHHAHEPQFRCMTVFESLCVCVSECVSVCESESVSACVFVVLERRAAMFP